MIFMGEEFCSESPFNFFVDFSDESLRAAVVAGRRAEHPQHDWSSGVSPVDWQAMVLSRIGSERDGDPDTRNWYQSLIHLRKQLLASGVLEQRYLTVESDVQRGTYQMWYRADCKRAVRVVVQISEAETNNLPVEIAVSSDAELLLDSRSAESVEHHLLMTNHAKIFGNY